MNYYLIGIKGAGMSSLAGILTDLGNNVVGYDDAKEYKFTEKILGEKNIKIYYDNCYQFNSDIVVYSAAIKDQHPELIRSREAGLRCFIYNKMLGELIKGFDAIAISGCHGKTTTTSLLAHILKDIVGANYLVGDGSGYAAKDNKYFVIEACEYKRHFLDYYPKNTIITNIELDHVDYYKDLDDVKNAYIDFANQTQNIIIACGDDQNILNVKNRINKEIYLYGLNDNNDFKAVNIITTNEGFTFDVKFKDKFIGNFKINHVGKHMLLNSLAAIVASYFEGLDMNKVALSLFTYKGAKRRFSESKIGNVIIIDDYAHHPTEVKAVIEAARQKYPNKEIVAIFQPHTYSRTKTLYKEVADVLNTIDKSYILDIYSSREKESDYPGVTNNLIIDLLDNGESIDRDNLSKLMSLHDSVVIFMSADDLHDMIDKYVALLNKR